MSEPPPPSAPSHDPSCDRAEAGAAPANRPRRPLVRLLRGALIGYLLVLGAMMLLENYLIFPAPEPSLGDWQAAHYDAEEAYFTAADGVRLHGWYVAHPEARAQLLFCHGNGEHVGYLGEYLQYLRDTLGVSVFAFDYRGYGRSEGRPEEQGVLADARAAREWLARRADLSPQQIVLMGRSLGGAVAVDLAAETGARALIVESTFTSLPDVAARLYPWAPVRWLMRTQLDSINKIGRYRGPLFQSHGDADEIAPIDLGRRLFEAAPAHPKKFLVLAGRRHNDPPPPEYYQQLAHFLDESLEPGGDGQGDRL